MSDPVPQSPNIFERESICPSLNNENCIFKQPSDNIYYKIFGKLTLFYCNPKRAPVLLINSTVSICSIPKARQTLGISIRF